MSDARQPGAPTGACPVGLPVARSNPTAQRKESGDAGAPARGNTVRPSIARRDPERRSAADLERLRGQLSERDLAVLRSIKEHRFLATRHVEALHFSDHASPLSAVRTARRVLRRLHQLDVIRHLERRVGGVRAGSASYVWSVGTIGDRLLRLDSGETSRLRHHEPSERLLLHTLAVADLHTALVTAARAGRIELLHIQTEPSSWRRYLGPAGEPAVLQPDLYAVTGAGAFEDCWFLEVDLGNEHVPTILRKCTQYEAYRATGIEQRDGGTFPRVVWIMTTPERAARLEQAIHGSPGRDKALFRVTLPDQLVSTVAGGAA